MLAKAETVVPNLILVTVHFLTLKPIRIIIASPNETSWKRKREIAVQGQHTGLAKKENEREESEAMQ